MRIVNVEQGTLQWHAQRRCKVTGTKLKRVMGTEAAQRDLLAELMAEKATEQSKVLKPTAEMQRGNAEEVFAIKEFENRYNKKVDEVGICIHDELDWVALSPDGMIEIDGEYTEAVEVKSPDSKKAILYRMDNMLGRAKGSKGGAPFLGVPGEYKWQAVQYFVVNEKLKKLYFVIYDTRFIEAEKRLYVIELDRDNEVLQDAIQEAERGLEKFRKTWMQVEQEIMPVDF